MKVSYLLIIIPALAFSPQSHAESWLDAIKSMFGVELEAKAETPTMPNVADMITDEGKKIKEQLMQGLSDFSV
jgi:hypothetical protein